MTHRKLNVYWILSPSVEVSCTDVELFALYPFCFWGFWSDVLGPHGPRYKLCTWYVQESGHICMKTVQWCSTVLQSGQTGLFACLQLVAKPGIRYYMHPTTDLCQNRVAPQSNVSAALCAVSPWVRGRCVEDCRLIRILDVCCFVGGCAEFSLGLECFRCPQHVIGFMFLRVA